MLSRGPRKGRSPTQTMVSNKMSRHLHAVFLTPFSRTPHFNATSPQDPDFLFKALALDVSTSTFMQMDRVLSALFHFFRAHIAHRQQTTRLLLLRFRGAPLVCQLVCFFGVCVEHHLVCHLLPPFDLRHEVFFMSFHQLTFLAIVYFQTGSSPHFLQQLLLAPV